MRLGPLLLLLLLLCSATVHADDLFGEWSIDAGMCGEARLTYTAGGRHEALMFEDGAWKTMASSRYRREGERVIIDVAPGRLDILEILSLDADRMVLRNADDAKMQAIEMESVTLVRCPPR